jgi:UDP-N-acetylglucosamine 4,6-dehydratase
MTEKLTALGHTVCVYSRDEVKQFRMPKNDYTRFFIGDVRDYSRLSRSMIGCNVVIHAAALKRIEVGQFNPDEMIKTNVLGSMNVIEAAAERGVGIVVGLSSDKAWQPVSPYGQTKALMESLFLSARNIYGMSGPNFLVTRYGNVSGSTGSVIPIWREQIKNGAKKVTVTDPGCTRFWMTKDQACDLVWQAVLKPTATGPIIPELPGFALGDLAEAMGVGMNIKGLPAWEKMHEGMCEGNTSDKTRRMSVSELIEGLKYV